MPDLLVEDVWKEYPTVGEPLVVLRGVSLSLSAGENLAILGPSGSGKSTLLHLIATLDRPSSGKVQIDGVDPTALSEPELAQFRNQHVGLVFQDHYLLPQCTVLENVLLPTLAAGRPTDAAVTWARTLLEKVGLANRLTHRPAELSGGERQRAAVARALVQKPRLLVADEPTGNLDRTTAMAVGRLLLDLQTEHQMMLVVVTHSLELAALFTRRWQLDSGQLETA